MCPLGTTSTHKLHQHWRSSPTNTNNCKLASFKKVATEAGSSRSSEAGEIDLRRRLLAELGIPRKRRRVWPLLPRKLDFFSEIALFTYLRCSHTHTHTIPARSFGKQKSTAVEEFFTKVCSKRGPVLQHWLPCSSFFVRLARFPVAL